MSATQKPRINRCYGKERSFGDVIYNPQTKSVFANIELGVFGRLTLTLVQREDGGFDLMKPYKNKDGQNTVVKLGRTFPVKDKAGNPVDGITKGALGLLRQYDETLKKEITVGNDALFISTHKLQEKKPLGESGLFKVGYIKGQIGVEIDPNAQNGEHYDESAQASNDDEEIPF